jgi:hypothetical protein
LLSLLPVLSETQYQKSRNAVLSTTSRCTCHIRDVRHDFLTETPCLPRWQSRLSKSLYAPQYSFRVRTRAHLQCYFYSCVHPSSGMVKLPNPRNGAAPRIQLCALQARKPLTVHQKTAHDDCSSYPLSLVHSPGVRHLSAVPPVQTKTCIHQVRKSILRTSTGS